MNMLEPSDTINIPKCITNKIGRNLHENESHPICIIKKLIYQYFDSLEDKEFEKFENLNPIVSIENNFDLLLIPKDHAARSQSDTYYVDKDHVLRTHTSAHQNSLMINGSTSFLVTGDVYRKDEIDSNHYPIFHQMEGVCINLENIDENYLKDDLIKVLKGLCEHLFPGSEVRINSDYFPFTNPSFEMEVLHNEKWIEILGCGIIQEKIIEHCAKQNEKLSLKKGWAFGLGLDRLAMILFNIPDIRMFWVIDNKFIDQFSAGKVTKFVPYSQLDEMSKDVSFYIPNEQIKINDINEKSWIRENDMYQIIREIANNKYLDIVSRVIMFDQYYNTKLNKLSRAYKIYYCPPDPVMNNHGELTALVNSLHTNISKNMCKELGLELR